METGTFYWVVSVLLGINTFFAFGAWGDACAGRRVLANQLERTQKRVDVLAKED